MSAAASHCNLAEAAPQSKGSACAHAGPQGAADGDLPALAPTVRRSSGVFGASGVARAADGGALLPRLAFQARGALQTASKFADAAGVVREAEPPAVPPQLSPGQLFNPTRRGCGGSGQPGGGAARPLAAPGLGEERSARQRSCIKWASNAGPWDLQAEALAPQLSGERLTLRLRNEFGAGSGELGARTAASDSPEEQRAASARGPIRRSLTQSSLRKRVSAEADSPPSGTATPSEKEAASAPSQRARRVSSYLRPVYSVPGAEPLIYMIVCDRDAVMRAMQAVKERQAGMVQRAQTHDPDAGLSDSASGDACAGACAVALSAGLPQASKQGACNTGAGQPIRERGLEKLGSCKERGMSHPSQHPGHKESKACSVAADPRPETDMDDEGTGSKLARRRAPPKRQRSCFQLIHTDREGDRKGKLSVYVMLYDKETVARAIKMAHTRRAWQRMLQRLQPLVAKLSPSGRAMFLKVWMEPGGGKRPRDMAAARHVLLVAA